MNNVLVFCEKSNDSIARVSLELISKARELADILKVKVEALIIGDTSVKSMAKEAIAYGADIIYTHTDDRLKEYLTLPYTNIIVQLVKKKKPPKAGLIWYSKSL